MGTFGGGPWGDWDTRLSHACGVCGVSVCDFHVCIVCGVSASGRTPSLHTCPVMLPVSM